ncbi:MAG: AMP-binding protein [Eubacteriales bacterium]|nr:AMP-binding protein [Eubacteriales bacterium]
MEKLNDLKQLMDRAVENYPDNVAFTIKIAKEKYRDVTYREYADEVSFLGEALIDRGYSDSKIALYGKNSYGWFEANVAAQLMGAVSVPLDKDLKYDELELSLERCQAAVIFYDKKQAAFVKQAVESGKTNIKDAFPVYDCQETGIDDLIEEGRSLRRQGVNKMADVVIDPDRVSFLIFTSGTTALSKIVMLSQRNIAADVTAMRNAVYFGDDETSIALLPYHHTYGSTGQWYFLAGGSRTTFCDGLKHIQQNLKEYGVSGMFGVPLLIESIYKRIMKTLDKNHLTGYVNAMRKVTRGLNFAKIDVRRRVFRGIVDALGGKLRLVVLGASAADPEVIKALNDFGVVCLQGYGLTETSPVVTSERVESRREGSVGQPLEGIHVDISDPDQNGVGEIIIRGDTVMKGYYNDEEDTEEVLRDGWFYTGDLGYIDKDGFLYITGRKKNVIVLRNGKNVFPEELEEEIGKIPYVAENIVVGLDNEVEGRDIVVTAKIVYDKEAFAGKSHDEIEQAVQADIDKINDTVPAYKRIKRVIVTDEPMVKTSTQKVKRFIEIQKIEEEERKAREKRAEQAEEK